MELTYRKDHRTVQQFLKDIQHGTQVESQIIACYANYIQKKYKRRVRISDNGCNNSGKIMRDKKVHASADYRLDEQLVEVKFNNEILDVFHLKEYQLKQYQKQRAVILWVNGWETESPTFTVIKSRHLKTIQQSKLVPFKAWGGKLCYRLHAKDYQWYRLPK